jgi:hypothetical protein
VGLSTVAPCRVLTICCILLFFFLLLYLPYPKKKGRFSLLIIYVK